MERCWYDVAWCLVLRSVGSWLQKKPFQAPLVVSEILIGVLIPRESHYFGGLHQGSPYVRKSPHAPSRTHTAARGRLTGGGSCSVGCRRLRGHGTTQSMGRQRMTRRAPHALNTEGGFRSWGYLIAVLRNEKGILLWGLCSGSTIFVSPHKATQWHRDVLRSSKTFSA